MLATVSCPNCFNLLVDGAAFCPHCGAARSRTLTGEPVSTKCPACHAGMQWARVGTVDLLECTACDGTWIEAAAFEQLCADKEKQAAVLQRPRGMASSTPAAAPIRYRPCPLCGKLMNRINFGRLSGTVIDVCKGHGTFMDRGELHQIVDFILNGGLDRARQVARDEMADQERRLEQDRAPGSLRWDERSLHDLLSAIGGRG